MRKCEDCCPNSEQTEVHTCTRCFFRTKKILKLVDKNLSIIHLLLFQMKSYVWESKGYSIAWFYQFWLPNPEFWKLSWYVQRWFRVVTFYIKTFIALDQFKNWYHNWWKGDIRASGYTYNLWWPVFKLIFNVCFKKN